MDEEGHDTVLWQGAPAKAPWLIAADAVVVPLSILWTGVVVSIAWQGPLDDPVTLVGTLFVAFGLYVSVGRLIIRRRRWKTARYQVTRSRVISQLGRSTATAFLDQLPPATRIGTGTVGSIGFGSTFRIHQAMALEGWPGGASQQSTIHPVLAHIDNADRVLAILVDAQKKARRR